MPQTLFVIATSIAAWAVRCWFDTKGTAQDAFTLTAFLLLRHTAVIGNLLSAVVERHLLALVTVIVGTATCLVIYSEIQGYMRIFPDLQSGGSLVFQSEHFWKPLFFPCRTTHTRLFPKKHSFSYSYLLVGLPVSWHGRDRSIGTAHLQPAYGKDGFCWQVSKSGKSWFSVNATDYMARGEDDLGLEEKLHAYLRTQVRDSTDKLMICAYNYAEHGA